MNNSSIYLWRFCLSAVFCVTLNAGCSTMFVKSPSVNDWDAIANNINSSPAPKINEQVVANSYDKLIQDQKIDGDGTGDSTKYVGNAFVDSYRRLISDLPDVTQAQELFKSGLVLFEQKKYASAAKEFDSCIWKCAPEDSVLKEDAMFMVAESYFFDNQYSKAVKRYEKLSKEYENSRYNDRMAARLFAIGRYWENIHDKHQYGKFTPNFFDKTRPWFDTNGNAIKAFTSVQMQNANGTFADAAIMATGNNYFRNGMYTEASEQYDTLCENYSNSKYLLRAHLLNLQCKLQMYSGPHYDAKPLEDAEKIAKHLISFYGPELTPEMKSELSEIQNYFVEQKAQRDLIIAQYYQGKQYYGSARQYYGYVQQDFPGTEAAKQAKEGYSQIASLPAEPAKHFEWLKYVFPED